MPIDEMFQEGTDKVLDDRVARPLQAPPVRPSFSASLWNTTKALPAGAVAGANESVGFMADILGTFGAVQSAYGLQADPTNLFRPDEQQKRIAAGQKSRDEIQSGEAFSTELGTGLRATARSYMPDPTTSNAAEQVLFGLGRFATKAVGYSVAAGPVVGAVLTGTDEGMTEADKLKAEGVDFATRTKVGAVAGVSAAAAVALPVAGSTVAQTAGLVAAGGPGSFIAQQAASKVILQHAGYDKISDQYDPFDPVGLAVATLVPAGFGAYAMRGAKPMTKAAPVDAAAARELAQMAANERLALKYDDPRLDAYTVAAAQREGIPPEALLAIKNVGEKSGPTAVSPKGAKGVMQFMDETWTAYGKGDPRDPAASIDAGARYMKDLIKQYDGDVRAAIAHYNGGGKAGKAVKEGKAAPAAETRKYLQRTDDYMAERQGGESGKAAANDPEAVAAARVALAREVIDSTNLHAADDIRGADDHLNAVMRASDQLAAGERVNVGDLIRSDELLPMMERPAFRDWFGSSKVLDDAGKALVVYHGTKANFDSFSREAIGSSLDSGKLGEGFYFSGDHRWASSYAERAKGAAESDAPHVMPVYLKMDNPLVLEASKGPVWDSLRAKSDEFGVKLDPVTDRASNAPNPAWSKEFTKAAIAAGHDGVVLKMANGKHEYVAFSPEQIKSATGNSGKFDRFSASLTDQIKPKDSKASPSAPDQSTGSSNAKADTNHMAASIDAQSTEIAKLSPDMMVQLEGMDKPMRLSDALEAVKAEAAKEVKEAPLLQVAAECFLRNA